MSLISLILCGVSVLLSTENFMAFSNLLKSHIQTFETPNFSSPFLQHQKPQFFSFLPFPKTHNQTSYTSLHITSALSSSTPPSSKEEAILQAKTCLSTTLEKPLNNPKLAGKLKKLKQPRFQVEIPIIDDSPASLSQLAFDLFNNVSVKRKGSNVKILIIWPNSNSKNAGIESFRSHSSRNIEHADIVSVINSNGRSLTFDSVEVAVFLAPDISQISSIKTISENLYPKPVVILNPKWGYGEENDFGELHGFIGSFEVIYSFLGLEVQGILSKRKGVVFKCVRDGIVSGEKWTILVEEEGGELKVVSKFKIRPSIGEVETVLYNLMAINSPITKSAKFLKDLVSNVTGKK
ncbi:uncharacterized protein LOC126666654 [Mercurialis annua]|uniref:uncharacterized protein LOC126666654 n=1 Tax=Mercurialis annua TaxID=3986 RepID=UPI00215F0B79|nr:uncharacterized protein LOC126666654 [Mercurialis annua]